MALKRLAWFLIALSFISLPKALAQKKNPDGEPVLLLTGGQREHHGYREQALYLAGQMEDTGRFRVTLCEDAAILTTSALGKYKAVIVNADRRDPEFKFTQAEQKALLDYVRAGHGFVSIHAADNAAPDWLPEWQEMLGAIFSHRGLPDGKVRKGEYTVKILDSGHPVAAGLKDFPIRDELYYHLQMAPGVEPLATIHHDAVDWPIAWTRTFGKGKVFHLVLGHRDFGPEKEDPMRDPNLGRMFLQGVEFVTH